MVTFFNKVVREKLEMSVMENCHHMQTIFCPYSFFMTPPLPLFSLRSKTLRMNPKLSFMRYERKKQTTTKEKEKGKEK